MNIKLLKKLRKEASKRYVIKRMATGFYTYDMKKDFRCGNGTDTLEEQKHNCKEYMTSWIEDSVKELRRKYSKWKVIHYYPW